MYNRIWLEEIRPAIDALRGRIASICTALRRQEKDNRAAQLWLVWVLLEHIEEELDVERWPDEKDPPGIDKTKGPR